MRKKATIIITDEGRDKGKYYLLTEKPAIPATKWAIRALQAAIRAGVNIPDDIVSRGMEAVAAVGIQTLILMDFAALDPLMDELMECIEIIRDPIKNPTQAYPMLPGGDDIEEIATIVKLQREVISLHANFSTLASVSTSTSEHQPSTSTSTRTSRPSSVRPSPRRSPRL